MKRRRQVFSRMLFYLKQFKTKLLISLLLLVIALGVEATGPFIIKTIIDKHVTSVQNDWYIVPRDKLSEDTKSIEFRGKDFVREDWIPPDIVDPSWSEANIIVGSSGFYLKYDGTKIKLNSSNIKNFYKYDFLPAMQLLLLFSVLLLFFVSLSLINKYMFESTGLTIVQKIRNDVMNKLHKIPVSYYDNNSSGQIVTKIINDTDAISGFFVNLLPTLLVSFTTILYSWTMLYYLDVTLANYCLLFLPVWTLITWVYLKKSQPVVQKLRESIGNLNSQLYEYITSMPIIQIFGKEKTVVDEFSKSSNELYQTQLKNNKINFFLTGNMMTLFVRLIPAVVIWYFAGRSLQSAISIGTMYAFIEYLTRFVNNFHTIFNQVSNVQRSLISAERVFELLDVVSKEKELKKYETGIHGDIKFENVSFSYKNDQYVLKNISFEAKKGKTMAIVGHTGSGKSTIVNLILGFYSTSSGRILIDGRNIEDYTQEDFKNHIGVVFQDPQLLQGDIKANVSLYRDISEEEIKRALQEAGAESFIKNLEDRFDESVDEKKQFSLGQKQLISLARALANRPSILLLDEATSNIDTETEKLIQKSIKKNAKDRTTIIVAHRLSTVKDADHILVLHQGEIVEQGNHDALMKLKGKYHNMFTLQSGNHLDK